MGVLRGPLFETRQKILLGGAQVEDFWITERNKIHQTKVKD